MLEKDQNGMLSMTQIRPQERFARWLLLLTMLHTVPVVWITPVAVGTVPAAALFALGFASLLSFEREDMSFALFALAPAFLYVGIGWLLAWRLAKRLERMRKSARVTLLAVLVVAALVSVYWPIYIAGSHNGSRSADLIELFRSPPPIHTETAISQNKGTISLITDTVTEIIPVGYENAELAAARAAANEMLRA